jgi:hypothetical protein
MRLFCGFHLMQHHPGCPVGYCSFQLFIDAENYLKVVARKNKAAGSEVWQFATI